MIAEVLSPGTESYDRGVKLGHYRQLPSLQEYLLVSQDRPLVEQYVRQGERWVLTTCAGLESRLALASVPAIIPLAETYDRVELPTETGR